MFQVNLGIIDARPHILVQGVGGGGGLELDTA